MIPFPRRGLYAITQCENKTTGTILAEVAAAIRGGAAVIQYRDKNNNGRAALAGELIRVCHRQNIPLIINDDIELALQVQADGVHLGKDDDNLEMAREALGSSAIIGVSCYNDLDRAVHAQDVGADYVAFGRFFPSSSKPLATPAEMDTLRKAKETIRIPIVAIGGILPENGGQLLAAGADSLAVIGGIFEREPEQSALAFKALFDRQL